MLATAVVVGALGVVMLPNIVYSAFLLGGVFLSVAGLYLMLNASFIAAAQILIYVGAVNVLILFAIMLVNKKEATGPPALGCGGCCPLGFAWDCCSAAARGLQHPRATPGPAAIGEDAVIRMASTCSAITCCRLSWRRCCC